MSMILDAQSTKDDFRSLGATVVRPSGSAVTKFPAKLHFVLKESIKDGFHDVVSWQPHGRCFIVHKPKDFETKILPFYFQQSKFTSFQRQLSFYGFRRIATGAEKGGYYHEMFLRGQEELANRIQRTKIKGTGPRKSSALDSPTPDFYRMQALSEDNGTITTRNSRIQEQNSGTTFCVPVAHDHHVDSNASFSTSLILPVTGSGPSILTDLPKDSSLYSTDRSTTSHPTTVSIFNQFLPSQVQTTSLNRLLGDLPELNNGLLPSYRRETNFRSGTDVLRMIEAAQFIADQATDILVSQHQQVAASIASANIARRSALLQFLQERANF